MSTLFADILNNTQGNGDTPSQNPLVLFLQQEDDVEAFRIWAQHFQNNAAIQKLPIRQWLAQQIALIDELIAEQLNAILHHKKMQALESSWRSLKKLCDESYGYSNIKLRLLNVSWAEVCRDITKAQDFDQSQLFQRIYTDEFGMPGGEPYGLLVAIIILAINPIKAIALTISKCCKGYRKSRQRRLRHWCAVRHRSCLAWMIIPR